jgi:predicted acylesterase/phospholipase RssA
MKNGSQDNINAINSIITMMQTCKLQQVEKPSLAKAFKIASGAALPDINEAMRLVTIIRGEGKIRAPKPPIKYPVFQGGGAKGGAYIGAYEALDKMGHLDEVVCPGGASAGGIVAFFMSLGFDSKQFKVISENLHFNDFIELKKNGWSEFLNGHSIGTALDVIRYGAASPGKSVHHWASYYVEKVLGNKDATFRDLHEKMSSDPTLKDLLLTATHYGTKDDEKAEQVFSFATTPDVVIADAFRATISYPGAFEPWQVRQKEIVEGKVSYQSLGFFADGGILNNLPVTSYNRECYADKHYQALERKDHSDLPVMVNPCVLGFSLTDLASLNDDITPLTKRVKQLQQANSQGYTVSKAQVADSSWHLMDIAKAALWNTFGKPSPESITDKQKIYFDQTIQVWPENVSTLEFDVSKNKLERIITNGKDATQLWLEKFRNPKDSYDYKKSYDDRLSKMEEKQKLKDPKGFYFVKLRTLFADFTKEMNRQGKINSSDNAIITNTRLRYLASELIKYNEESKNANIEVTRDSFIKSCQSLQQNAMLVQQQRTYRWDMVLPEKIQKNICDQLLTDPVSAVKLLKCQLSNIPSLAGKNHSELLQALVATNNIKLTEKVLHIISKTLLKSYYQGKEKSPFDKLAQLLNNANPSLFKIALKNNNLEMVKVLIKHGASVVSHNPVTGLNALQDAIELSHFAGFKAMVMTCVDDQQSLSNFRIGKESLWQYIFRTASCKFISSLCKSLGFLRAIMNQETDEKGMNIMHHLASKGTPSAFSTIAYHLLAGGTQSKSLLTNTDQMGNSPLAYILQYNRCDILKQLLIVGIGKLCGYFTNGNYHFDQIFNIKDPSVANRRDYKDLEQACVNHPKLYQFILKNFSSVTKAAAVNERIKREVEFGAHDQAVHQQKDILIKQEPLIYHSILPKENVLFKEVEVKRRLSFSIAA